jgi:hypothetical protein
MVQEVNAYGEVLSVEGVEKSPADLLLDKLNYDPKVYSKRPEGWMTLRSQRTHAKEASSQQQKSFDELEKLEDALMVKETATYGHPLALGAALRKPITADDLVISSATFDPADSNRRPDGWLEVRNARVLSKEAAAEVDKKSLLLIRPQRDKEEEAQMLREVEQYGRVLPVLNVKVAELTIDPVKFDAKDQRKRPAGWLELRATRVLDKEAAKGVEQKTRLTLRPAREQQEESSMIGEVQVYGKLFNIDYDRQMTPGGGRPINPPEWELLRLRRVQAKEATMIGVDAKTLAESRHQRIEEEDALMKNELLMYGAVLSSESLGLNSIAPSNLVINSSTFDPNTNLRPTGWAEIRKKRVGEKEYAASADRETLNKLRPQREQAV